MENQKETGVQSALEAKVYQLEQEKHQLEEEKHQLEQEKRQLEEERTHDKELRSEIEDENQLLNVCIDGLQDKVRHLESKMHPSVAHLKGLKKRLSIAEFNYSKVLQECQHLKEENRNLKDIKQLEREKAEFQRRAESLEEELKLIKEQNPNQGLQDIEGGKKLLRVCIAGLQDKVRDLESEMDPSVAYLKGLKEKLDIAEFNYSKVLQECQHLKEENRNLKDIQKLEREKAEFQRRAESLEEELKLIKEQNPNQDLQEKLEVAEFNYSDVLKECQHLKEENCNLNMELKGQQQEIQQLEERLMKLKGQQPDIQQLEREKAESQMRAESLEEELKLIKEPKAKQGLKKLFRVNRKPAHDDQKASKNSSNSKGPSLKND